MRCAHVNSPLDGQLYFKEFSGQIVVPVKKVSVGSESSTKDVYCSDLSRGICSYQQQPTSPSKKSNYNHTLQRTLHAHTVLDQNLLLRWPWWESEPGDGHIQPLLKQSAFLLALRLVCLSNQVPGPGGAGLDGPWWQIQGPTLIKSVGWDSGLCLKFRGKSPWEQMATRHSTSGSQTNLSVLWKIQQMTVLQYLSQYSRSRKSSTQVKGEWTFKKDSFLILKASLGLKTDGAMTSPALMHRSRCEWGSSHQGKKAVS